MCVRFSGHVLLPHINELVLLFQRSIPLYPPPSVLSFPLCSPDTQQDCKYRSCLIFMMWSFWAGPNISPADQRRVKNDQGCICNVRFVLSGWQRCLEVIVDMWPFQMTGLPSDPAREASDRVGDALDAEKGGKVADRQKQFAAISPSSQKPCIKTTVAPNGYQTCK